MHQMIMNEYINGLAPHFANVGHFGRASCFTDFFVPCAFQRESKSPSRLEFHPSVRINPLT